MQILRQKIFEIYFLLFLYVIKVHGRTSENGPSSVKFYVYTRQNAESPQPLSADVESIVRNIFNPTKPITLAIHDVMGDQYAEEYSYIKDTMLKVEDVNVIIVDYSSLRDHNESMIPTAIKVYPAIAELILLLQNNFNVNLKTLHMVGFGLGAHIAGLVGQQVYKYSGEKVKQITALDPDGTEFTVSTKDEEKLSPDDADYVEVVHTNGGFYGYLASCGHVDYYLNGGKIQPGCNVSENTCSHNRAFKIVPEMWSPIANHELLILKCENIEFMSIDSCRWHSQQMCDLSQNSKGLYYVETNDHYPYGKGAFKTQFF